MTKEQILARRALIEQERAQAALEIRDLERLRDTQFGVIQDCDHWLRVIAAEEETARLAADKTDIDRIFDEAGQQRAEVLEFRTVQGDAIAEAEEREARRECPPAEYLAAGGR